MNTNKYNGVKNIKEIRKFEWCLVDVDNVFKFNGEVFVISDDVDNYRVFNKYGDVEDYTNESKMIKVLCILSKDNTIEFYDQSFERIHPNLVSKLL